MQIFHEELRYLRGGIVLLEERGRFDMVYYYHLHPFTYILVGFHRGNPVFTNQPVGKVRLCKVPPNSLGEFYGFWYIQLDTGMGWTYTNLYLGGYWGGPSLCDWIHYPISNTQCFVTETRIYDGKSDTYITVHHWVSIMFGDHQHTSFIESASTNTWIDCQWICSREICQETSVFDR